MESEFDISVGTLSWAAGIYIIKACGRRVGIILIYIYNVISRRICLKIINFNT